MKARVKWVEQMTFLAESNSGHATVIDVSTEGGGRNLGMSPMEMVLLGTGGCTALDIIQILGKARQEVTDCVVELEAERAAEAPKVFTRIHVRYLVTGRNLQEHQVQRAIQLSAEKYCSASVMLGKTAVITHDYQIIPVS